jgi:hypothetical protein
MGTKTVITGLATMQLAKNVITYTTIQWSHVKVSPVRGFVHVGFAVTVASIASPIGVSSMFLAALSYTKLIVIVQLIRAARLRCMDNILSEIWP